ncbi:MAG: AAA family ATPase [Actinomycetota bacterium]|nr:AAA family ATPase [Actinomycetota bacterium]
MEYQILGPLSVQRDGRPAELGGLRQRTVLAALLVAGGRAVGAETLIDQVWGDDAPPKPLASLRAYVTNLRGVVGHDALLRTSHGYVLDTTGAIVDSLEFIRLVHAGRVLLESGDVAEARANLTDGLALWRGEPLGEFRQLNFVTPEVHRLETLRVDGVEAYFEAALRLGETATLIDGLESELVANPLRETLWGQLMLALYRCGRRSDALRAYARARDVLDAELGVRPGVELERLAANVRNESPALDWEPIADGRSGPAARRGGPELFGREAELHRLEDALTAASHGRGGILVIRGDSGMGKTALAQRTFEMARDAGMATVWAGHAAGVRRPPSWAWAHAVRGLAGQLPVGSRRPHTPLPDGWSVAAEDAGIDEERSTFDAVEATTTALAELVAAKPGLIVLDDVQRAGRFTRQVLEHLASAGRCSRLLVVATWQDGGAGGASAARAFDRLAGRTDVDVLTLRGLDQAAAALLIADTCGATAGADFVRGVHDRTGGNPFYVREVVRLLADNGRLDDMEAPFDTESVVPEAVSGVIRRRTSRLPQSTRTVLRVAAVAGTEFAVARLAGVRTASVAEIGRHLAPAVAAGLVGPTTDRPGWYRFSHGLVRDAVAAETTGVDRAILHAAIARTYASEHGEAASQDAIDGAQHAWDAGVELDADTALLLLDRARADAWSRCAYGEVAELDRRALDACSRLPAGGGRFDREVDLRLQLASVEAVVTGQSSARTLADLRYSSAPGHDAVQSTTAVVMGCLEACGTGRYHDAAVLSDGLVDFFTATGDPIAGAAGYYIRSLTHFMRGTLDVALGSVAHLHANVPSVDWRTYGALASFEVLAYAVAAHATALRGDRVAARAVLAAGIALGTDRGDAFGTAVLRTADVQLDAMTGHHEGLSTRAAEVVALLTELGIDQFVGGARLIHGWARAVGADGVDTVDEMHAAINLHSQGGRRIFSPLYYGLLADATAAHRDVGGARACLNHADAIASATGEHVWDAQSLARRLRLAAPQSLERR